MSVVCVVGLGYIGLPVASMLASRGHEVVGYDVSERAVSSINQGRAHFFEPDLDMLLKAAVQTGRLRAQNEPVEADYYVIAVPTPFRDGHKPDLSYIDAATAAIAPCLKAGSTVVLESTSPVGATERMTRQLASLRPDLNFPRYKESRPDTNVAVAHCPERILPGQMMRELITNDRIIGGMTRECAEAAAKLYGSFVTADAFRTDCRTAEFVKLIENSFRDVNIAFANELSVICEKLGIDVWSAIDLANRHPRVNILQPGPGVGGHCIAVDPWFIVDSAPEEARMIRMAREVNEAKPHWVADRVVHHAERFKSPVVGCYGLAYKPDVEDLRESPSLQIVRWLASHKDLSLVVCEPMIERLPDDLREAGNVKLASMDETREQSDIVAFLVAHRAFRAFHRNQFLNKIVVDAAGLLSQPS
ncbi:MAG: UDP-N-acetyl-D-mannosamine dehydrogenase [Hyphomicrobiales bacterium]|nr:UDP-N-acetyl-D-mannosamine dehydrogenase [Hyphomicrobiales bacterium]